MNANTLSLMKGLMDKKKNLKKTDCSSLVHPCKPGDAIFLLGFLFIFVFCITLLE